LWLVGLNIAYSRPLHRAILKPMRLAVGVIVFGFPLFILAIVGLDLSLSRDKGPHPAWLALEIYLIICLAMCCGMIPLFTIIRLLRREPPQMVSRRSQVVDTMRELGEKPVGDGKYRHLTLLPGNQSFQIEFTELTLCLPELPPAWDGLTILQLSDLHFTGSPDRRYYELAIERAMAAGTPDILAVTGDLIDTDTHHRWLLPLLHRLDWNEAAFAILGNHDIWHRPDRIRRRLTRLGMIVLNNAWTAVEIRGETLLAIGHEGPWFQPEPDLADCPKTAFRLLLSHTPDNINWARRHEINLMLSGHNHGGQIRLPFFGSLFVPSYYSRRYDCGLFWKSPTLLYVNRGLGGKEPLRYNCRPEVTRLILKRA
jgi:predicted MPP superfamily phosphohydrolase